MKYLSVHLFYENLNFLLKNAVFSFVEQGQENEYFKSYFFIRYTEGGKHIRLRLWSHETKKLKKICSTHFNHFFHEHPSTRTYYHPSFYPNNSLQFIDYQPEIERYGGQRWIKVAERHFYYSSELVKNFFQSNWFESRKKDMIGDVMQFHCIMLYAFDFTMEDAHRFFDKYYKRWYQVVPLSFFQSDYFKMVNKTLQNDELRQPIRALWKEMERTDEFEEDFLSNWYQQNQQMNSRLKIGKSQKWTMLENLIHMTNNRLGVTNPIEVVIAHILRRCFEE